MKPSKTDIQKSIAKSKKVEVIEQGTYSNMTADLKKIEQALKLGATVLIQW